MVTNRSLIILYRIAVFFFCAIFLNFAVAGCGLHKRQTSQIQVPPEVPDDLLKAVSNPYPTRFKAIHRVVLTLAGKDYVMNGYLSIDREKREIKLVAQNELGGTIFDVHYLENQINQVHSSLKSIKPQWLEKTMLRDLKALYLFTPLPSDQLQVQPAGELVLSRRDGLVRKKRLFATNTGSNSFSLKGIEHLRNKKAVYSATFGYKSPQYPRYPDHIFIKDKKMRYCLQINVQYFFPDTDSEKRDG